LRLFWPNIGHFETSPLRAKVDRFSLDLSDRWGLGVSKLDRYRVLTGVGGWNYPTTREEVESCKRSSRSYGSEPLTFALPRRYRLDDNASETSFPRATFYPVAKQGYVRRIGCGFLVRALDEQSTGQALVK